VYAGIRLGEVRVSKKKDRFAKRDIIVEGNVIVSEALGDRQYVLLDVNGINLKGIADIGEYLGIGDQVFIGVDPYSLYLFDKRTEISIIDYEALEKIKQKE